MSSTHETLEIKSSYVKNEILTVISHNVEDETLVLEKGVDYVERFAPKLLEDNETMQQIYAVEKEEMQKFHDEIQINIDNTYIQNLHLTGIQKWEKLLNLESNKTLDINTRQELLLTKRRFNPPFTRQNLYRILRSVWGKGNYTFDIYPIDENTGNRDYFSVIIDIHSNYPEVYLKFQNYVRSLIPANIYVIFSIQYTYLYLYRNLNYNNLSEMTYEELSKYAKKEK